MVEKDFTGLPDRIETEEQLDEVMTVPPPALVEYAGTLNDDILVLGVGGKMGTHLALMAKRAINAAGSSRKVIGVSRFSTPGKRKQLEDLGIETISCDLMEESALSDLPDTENIVFMAGRKFGTGGSEHVTWAMNAIMPAHVARRFPKSRIVAFSTGNVYPLSPITQGGALESGRTGPVGEYAITTLGRERVFQYYSEKNGTPVSLIRLNYAIDLRYGVLYDIGSRVFNNQEIDLTMGNANVIWQGDAVAHILLSFGLCDSPPRIVNVTGPEIMSIRWAANRFAELFDRQPRFTGEEGGEALVSNAAYALNHFGYPRVPVLRMVQWTAHWIRIGGATLDKPTHFETKDGAY